MSSPTADSPVADADQAAPYQLGEGIRYKSWRKKYRKMKLKFDDDMEDANELFVREHRAWNIARRIQEQNDQLLDILHDLELEIYPGNPTDIDTFRSKLSEELDALESSTTHTTVKLLDPSLPGAAPSDLLDLQPAIRLSTSTDPDDDLPPGYLTTNHEESYLTALDASLTTLPSTDNLPTSLEPIHPPTIPARDRKPPTQADFAHSNPISVYNWLHKNKPDMYLEKIVTAVGPGDVRVVPLISNTGSKYLHVNEELNERDRSGRSSPVAEGGNGSGNGNGNGSGNGSGNTSTAVSKRGRRRTIDKDALERDALDEDVGLDPTFEPGGGSGGGNGNGNGHSGTGTTAAGGKGKRKRDDDTYRPKGGHSRLAKRKKDKDKDRERKERTKMDSVTKAEDVEMEMDVDVDVDVEEEEEVDESGIVDKADEVLENDAATAGDEEVDGDKE